MFFNAGFSNLLCGINTVTSCVRGLGDYFRAKNSGASTGEAIATGLGTAALGTGIAFCGNAFDKGTGTYFGSIFSSMALNGGIGFPQMFPMGCCCAGGFFPPSPSIFGPRDGYCLPSWIRPNI